MHWRLSFAGSWGGTTPPKKNLCRGAKYQNLSPMKTHGQINYGNHWCDHHKFGLKLGVIDNTSTNHTIHDITPPITARCRDRASPVDGARWTRSHAHVHSEVLPTRQITPHVIIVFLIKQKHI